MAANPQETTIQWDANINEYTVDVSVVVKRKARIRFKNDTSGDEATDVTIQMSDDDLFVTPPPNPFRLGSGDAWTLELKDVACRGVHPFAVFCHDTMKYAIAASMPIIIVDPKK